MITTTRLIIRPLDQQLIDEMKSKAPIQQRFLNHVQKLSIDPTLKGWDAWIVQQKDGTYVGDIGFKGKPDQFKTIEVGYGFQEDYRGKGYATESVSALLEHTIATYPDIQIKATTLKENNSSHRVLQKLGFHQIEEDGSYYYWKK